ncbi:dihydrolipoyl dehydrogenase [Pseudoflavonifractor sp. HCP28S3_F10]|uniref:dihydrolipoyl dehydrogenase n=1 Tax=Pseudoflavonifractor sp. HCP28S3_F10 TaxID=3438947 RepID=UPI003F8BE6B5
MYDLVVIGAGPGGYVAAIRAAQLGMKTAIVEKDACGGTCLNYGCIPTKALYKNAEVVDEIARAAEFGVDVKGYSIDMEKVQARKDKIVKTLSGGVEGLLKANKVELVRGAAKIIAPGKVEVNGKVLETGKILIASGSKSSKPPIKGIDNPGVITSKEALEMDHVPGKIVIIGGGVIGIEFAGIYRAFGAEVTVVEFMPKIIPAVDKEITDRLQKLLEKKGIRFMVGTRVEEISKSGSALSVTVDKAGEKSSLPCDQVLVSTGRELDIEGLNLDGLGVAYDRKGVKVDENYMTSVPGIYAIGDVIGGVMLAHVASEEGKVCVERMAGEDARVDYDLIPSAIFTFPDVASIGLSEEQAKERGLEYEVGKFQFAGNGKALTMNAAEGMMKVIVSRDKQKILGVHIVGPNASDLLAEAALAMRGEFTVEEAANTMHGHPTLSEAFEEALTLTLGRGIHSMPARKKK